MKSFSDIVIFGAGKIGLGLLGQLVAGAGMRPVFVEANTELAGILVDAASYRVDLVGREESSHVISGYEVFTPGDGAGVAAAVAGCGFAATAVGGQHLPSVAQLLADGIRARSIPLNILVCENWPGADEVMTRALLDLGLMRQSFSCVPCSVERMVAGGRSPLHLTGESSESMLLDRSKWAGAEPGIEGMIPCDDINPFYARKLYTNNAGHAVLAYVGFLSGCALLHEALQVEMIRGALERLLNAAGEALAREYGLDRALLAEHNEHLMRYRFANRKLADTVSRVASEPLRKLKPKERLTGLVRLLQKHGLPGKPVSRIIGAVLHYNNPGDEQSVRMREMILANGPGCVLKEICGMNEKESCFMECLGSYGEWEGCLVSKGGNGVGS